MEQITRNIGQALKSMRRARNMSLDAAAQCTGVSKAMLGQIERGESMPTVLTLWKISSGLKVTMSSLLSTPGGADGDIVTVADIPPVYEEGGGMVLSNIFPFDPISGFDYYQILIRPRISHASIPHPNVEREYIIVSQGTLELTVDGSLYTLSAGQAFSFSGNAAHCYANPGGSDLVFQNIIRYR